MAQPMTIVLPRKTNIGYSTLSLSTQTVLGRAPWVGVSGVSYQPPTRALISRRSSDRSCVPAAMTGQYMALNY